ncbi:MAG: hypothetical protein ACXWEW_09600 [Nitrososphaeraceae archaeon]
MDDIFGLFSRRSGLSSNAASMGLSLVSKFLLRNAEPQRASGLMSMLPSSITNMFSGDERQKFTTSQENVWKVLRPILHELYSLKFLYYQRDLTFIAYS